MKRNISTIFLFSCLLNAHADDQWRGQDKVKHVSVSALIAGAVTVVQRDELQGFLASAAVGVAKEAYDYKHRDTQTASWKDFGADLIGAYFGTKLGGLLILPEGKGLTIGFVREF
ncbi:putative lipoprotein [Gammaproteobacteria bacterium]